MADAEKVIFHYTDHEGFNAIKASPTWIFRAGKPAGDHEFGAYFTTYVPPRPLYKLGLPKEKQEYVFCFKDAGDLTPIRGGRGAYIIYSKADYSVLPWQQ